MRSAILVAIFAVISGCVSLDSITPGEREAADTSYYLVDTKYRFFCLGNTKRCRDMTKIVSSRGSLGPIESAYGTTIKAPNYPVSLTRLIMNPTDGSYSAQPVGNDGRFFKVPVNSKTDTVWNTLSQIEENLFNSGS